MKQLLSVFVGLAVGSGAMAATITLTPVTSTQYAGTFSSSLATETFTLDLTGFSTSLNIATSLLTANSLFGQGYDITGATFDGIAFTPVVNTTIPGITSVDYWSYGSATVSPTLHTLVVSGASLGGGAFTGSIALSVQPIPTPAVPEPETYMMMLAGLGAIGFLAQRRRRV